MTTTSRTTSGRERNSQDGFTLIEIIIAVAMVGVLAVIVIPTLMKYITRSKTTEAIAQVQRIYQGARSHWSARKASGGAHAAQFPGDASGRAVNIPKDGPAAMCAMGGKLEKAVPDPAIWTAGPNSATWRELKFSMDEPHYYAYGYTSEVGLPGATDGSHNFTARAVGDLDCDGVFSRFSMYGAINQASLDGPPPSAEISRMDELE